jgi:hypothetical protein
MSNSPTGKRRGRPLSPDAFVYITVGLRPEHCSLHRVVKQN